MVAPATVPGILQTGIHSARPAATAVAVGAVYSCTTHRLIYQSDGSTWSTWLTLDAAAATKALEFSVDGGGVAITTGVKGFLQIPVAHTFTAWRVLGNPSGSIVFDIWRGSYADHVAGTIAVGDSITASNKPTLSSARGNEDTSITDWLEVGAAGDVYWFNVDSASTITLATLVLEYTT